VAESARVTSGACQPPHWPLPAAFDSAFSAMSCLLQLLHFGPHRLQLRQNRCSPVALPARAARPGARQPTPGSSHRRRRSKQQSARPIRGRGWVEAADPSSISPLPEADSTRELCGSCARLRWARPLSLSRPGPSAFAGGERIRPRSPQANQPRCTGSRISLPAPGLPPAQGPPATPTKRRHGAEQQQPHEAPSADLAGARSSGTAQRLIQGPEGRRARLTTELRLSLAIQGQLGTTGLGTRSARCSSYGRRLSQQRRNRPASSRHLAVRAFRQIEGAAEFATPRPIPATNARGAVTSKRSRGGSRVRLRLKRELRHRDRDWRVAQARREIGGRSGAGPPRVPRGHTPRRATAPRAGLQACSGASWRPDHLGPWAGPSSSIRYHRFRLPRGRLAGRNGPSWAGAPETASGTPMQTGWLRLENPWPANASRVRPSIPQRTSSTRWGRSPTVPVSGP